MVTAYLFPLLPSVTAPVAVSVLLVPALRLLKLCVNAATSPPTGARLSSAVCRVSDDGHRIFIPAVAVGHRARGRERLARARVAVVEALRERRHIPAHRRQAELRSLPCQRRWSPHIYSRCCRRSPRPWP